MTPERQIRHRATPSQEVLKKTEKFLAGSKAKNTLRAYAADWRHFNDWCQGQKVSEFPATPTVVAMYIADLAGTFATSTIRRRLTAIRKAHRLAEKPDPVSSPIVKEVLDGILREYGVFQRGKNPLRSTDLMAMLDCLSDDVGSQRNRAILLIGFAGAFRRSELTSLDCEDLDFRNEGVVVTIRRSKTDQYGKGDLKGIPRGRSSSTCPVAALENWLRTSGITTGAVFRPVTKSGSIRERRLTDKSVALIIKKLAVKAGLDATKYAGHSLRSGLATEAAYQGASERSIMKQGGWKSASMARRYIREGSLFHDNAGDKLGL